MQGNLYIPSPEVYNNIGGSFADRSSSNLMAPVLSSVVSPDHHHQLLQEQDFMRFGLNFGTSSSSSTSSSSTSLRNMGEYLTEKKSRK